MTGVANARIASRLISAIEMLDNEEADKVSLRRMFAQRNIKKALSNTPESEITMLDCIDSYDWAAALGDGSSIFGEWANRVMRHGYNAYHNSI